MEQRLKGGEKRSSVDGWRSSIPDGAMPDMPEQERGGRSSCHREAQGRKQEIQPD